VQARGSHALSCLVAVWDINGCRNRRGSKLRRMKGKKLFFSLFGFNVTVDLFAKNGLGLFSEGQMKVKEFNVKGTLVMLPKIYC